MMNCALQVQYVEILFFGCFCFVIMISKKMLRVIWRSKIIKL